MIISEFPITIKNPRALLGKIGFINLKTRAENNDIVILGKNDPQKDSFIYLDQETELGKINFKNLNQETKNSGDSRSRGIWL